MVSAGELIGELKVLRRGRGITTTQLAERVGPALRWACGITERDDSAETRSKVTERMRELGESLPEDLRIAVLAAFNLHDDAQHPFYQDRVRWVATKLQRDDRTVRRRIDEGIAQIAQLALATAGIDSPAVAEDRGWHTEELRVALALDQPVPEAFEFRRVVAEVDGLTEVDLAVTVPTLDPPADQPREADLDVAVFHGGRLTRRQMESSDRFGLVVLLPAPLRRGERHELALRFRARISHPHYVCVPRHPCDLFDLHVRFGDVGPSEVTVVEKAFQGDASDQAASSGERLLLDDSGEVHLRFHRLAPGFAYGVKWSEPEPR
ncbi:hypothetical protein [Amycolatopsis magusensis]|uniref:hypothetical protein n=1 Tax=Amycolatopsis magusensis TaxID=882444 RepID=UPI0024A8E24C|nr:hypothetical protein [Amycolatopsis magusensis]MDI5976856.1 hypothetical protein [Amycolatopsis magusensis]